MATPQLVTVSVAATTLKVTEPSVHNWIKRSEVQAKATTLIRGNSINLYDLEEIITAREAYAAMKPAPAKETPSFSLDALVERMSAEYQGLFKSVSADLAELVDNTATLREMIAKLAEQNVLLFKTVEALRVAAQSAATPVVPTPSNSPRLFTKVPDPTPVKPKAKICIVGLLATQQQMIAKEFDECFELRMFHTDDAKGPALTSAAENCDCVLLMTNFINHAVEDRVKAAGGKYEHVRGGMTTLRDRLTTLFANGVPTKKATA